MDYAFFFNSFTNWIELNYYLSFFIFFVFIFLYSMFSLPGLLLFFVFAGYSFGIFWSYIICIISETLGCLCFFIFAKYFFSKFFKQYYIKYSSKIDQFIKNSSLEYLIIFRLIPGPPLMVQNLILSLLEISYYKFIIATIVGFSPIILFSIFIGNKLNNLISLKNITSKDILTWDLLLIIILFITIILVRIFFKQRNK